jgi:hypothetical protein
MDYHKSKPMARRSRGGSGGSYGHSRNNGARLNNIESTFPGGHRTRGTAQQVYEKYRNLASDALSNDDPVLAENYNQYAEHYKRLIIKHEPPKSSPSRRLDNDQDSQPASDQPSQQDRQSARQNDSSDNRSTNRRDRYNNRDENAVDSRSTHRRDRYNNRDENSPDKRPSRDRPTHTKPSENPAASQKDQPKDSGDQGSKKPLSYHAEDDLLPGFLTKTPLSCPPESSTTKSPPRRARAPRRRPSESRDDKTES